MPFSGRFVLHKKVRVKIPALPRAAPTDFQTFPEDDEQGAIKSIFSAEGTKGPSEGQQAFT